MNRRIVSIETWYPRLMEKLCAAFGDVPPPRLEMVDSLPDGRVGEYEAGAIRLVCVPSEPALYTVLHEFAHHVVGDGYPCHGYAFFGILLAVAHCAFDGRVWMYDWSTETEEIQRRYRALRLTDMRSPRWIKNNAPEMLGG